MTAPKWGGPWIGAVTPGPPESGSFLLRPSVVLSNTLVAEGDQLPVEEALALEILLPGALGGYPPEAIVLEAPTSGSGLIRYTPGTIYLNGSPTPTDIGSLPAGFVVLSAAHHILAWSSSATPMTTQYLQFAEADESSGFNSETIWDGVFDHSGPFPLELADLITAGAGFRAVSGGVPQMWLGVQPEGSLWITGTYELVEE